MNEKIKIIDEPPAIRVGKNRNIFSEDTASKYLTAIYTNNNQRKR